MVDDSREHCHVDLNSAEQREPKAVPPCIGIFLRCRSVLLFILLQKCLQAAHAILEDTSFSSSLMATGFPLKLASWLPELRRDPSVVGSLWVED